MATSCAPTTQRLTTRRATWLAVAVAFVLAYETIERLSPEPVFPCRERRGLSRGARGGLRRRRQRAREPRSRERPSGDRGRVPARELCAADDCTAAAVDDARAGSDSDLSRRSGAHDDGRLQGDARRANGGGAVDPAWPDTHRRRRARQLAERALLRAVDGTGRPRWLRTVRPSAEAARSEPRCGRAADSHLAGVQLPRRRRRRPSGSGLRAPRKAPRRAVSARLAAHSIVREIRKESA